MDRPGNPRRRSSSAQARATADTCSGAITLGIVTAKFAGGPRERADEPIECSKASSVQLSGHRLDANANVGWERPALQSSTDFYGDTFGVTVLLSITPVAVAIFEIDSIVLNGLLSQFLDDARANGIGEGGVGQTYRVRERRAIGRVLVQRRNRHRAQARRGISLEQMGPAVKRVNRLAIAAFARTCARHAAIGTLQRPQDRLEVTKAQRR
jgi:hypothetical protein